MVAGTLHTYAKSFKGYKCQVAAEISGFTLNVVQVQENDTKHSHLPCFECPEKNTNLFEANAIAYYVSNEQLRGGASLEQNVQVLQWLNYGSTEVESAVCSWCYPLLGLVESSAALVKRAKDDLTKVFKFVDEHLKTRTYLVGQRLTLADIALAADLCLAYQHVADETFRKPFTNLNRWFQTIINQTHFSKIVGKINLVSKAEEFNPNKFATTQKAKEQKKEEKKPAAEKPKPKPKDDDDEEEDELLQEPKQNDPFATMPKGTFNMDEFKRTYSNQDTLTVAIPYFWQHFEKEFYSIWYCEYKYAAELTQTFMTANLIGGMYQRIEKLRKNAFASMCVLGENNNNTIAGVWFWKGHELVFPLCPDWTTDYESYTWRKLDPTNETDKKLVNDYFLQEVDLNGKKFVSGKIFK